MSSGPRVAGRPVEDPDVASVVCDAEMIEGALETLAVLIVSQLKDFSVFVPVATGAMTFASDLTRQCYVTQRVVRDDVVRTYARPVIACATCASYGDGTSNEGAKVDVRAPGAEVVRGRKVVILEDIIDSGRTAMALAKVLYEQGAEEVALIALMDKRERRDPEATKYFEEKNMKIACAFLCPDEFVVGYGLDYQGKYRDLPFVGILKPEIFAGEGGEK